MNSLAQWTAVAAGCLCISVLVITGTLISASRALWPGYVALGFSLFGLGVSAYSVWTFRVRGGLAVPWRLDVLTLIVVAAWVAFLAFAVAYVHYLPLKGGAGPTA